MRSILPSRLMAIYAGCNIVLLITAIFVPGWAGLSAVLATSFFMSLMFPTIFSLGLKDLGPNTNVAASLLVMMIVGGAVMPPIMGLLAEHLHSTALSYLVPLAGYVVTLAFALFMTRYHRHREALSTFEV
jgi:FHS family L-fucose permease-like MFS transporter